MAALNAFNPARPLRSIAFNAWLTGLPVGLVWFPLTGRVRDRLARRWLRVTVFFVMVDLAVSASQFTLVRVGYVYAGFLWANPKLSSILFDGSLRVPGLFNSSGHNSFFLTLVAFGIPNRKYWDTSKARWQQQVDSWGAVAAIGGAVALSLTRKVYVLAAPDVGFLGLRVLVKTAARSMLTLAPMISAGGIGFGILAVGHDGGVLLAVRQNEVLVVSGASMDSRRNEWRESISVLHQHPKAVLVGTGLAQRARTFSTRLPVSCVDNMLLSLALHCVIPFVVIYLWFVSSVFRALSRAVRRVIHKARLCWTVRTCLRPLLAYGLFGVGSNDLGLRPFIHLASGWSSMHGVVGAMRSGTRDLADA